ncbi:hypothetical protein NM688_g7600 [Phlebia brevispora]|uniref:Uncharacterized protein n=1 Tax=Phlebia brevispora TaxID=194682 RepID=A0ACC1S3J7_9APHY|nr:hypothetical protein NM688_g7600 [Phlebia brevispora]
MAVNQVSLANLMQSAEARRSQIAALCFLVWDIVITMDDEVTHIWLTPFQPLKLLYLFTRYYSASVLITLNARNLSCQEWVAFEAISAILLEIAVEIILMLRIYAMYAASRKLLRCLIPSFVAQVLIMIASLAVSLPRVMSTPLCIATTFPIEIIAYTISSIIFESFLFGLTVYKFFAARREGWGKKSLLTVLVRDSVWAFAVVLIAMISNTLFFTLAPATLAALGFPFLLAILGTLGPRLVLNVRIQHARNSVTDDESVDLSLPASIYSPVNTSDIDLPSHTDSSRRSRISRPSWLRFSS